MNGELANQAAKSLAQQAITEQDDASQVAFIFGNYGRGQRAD